MAAYAHYDDPFFSRRTIIFLAIVGLHVVLFFGFATGLGTRIIAAIPPSMITDFLPDPPKHVDPPPPIREPQLTSNRLVIPPLVDPSLTTIDTDTIQGVTTEVLPPPPAQPLPPRTVNRVLGGPGKGFPNTEDYYPQSLIREHQEGAVTVRSCVDDKGRLTAPPTVADSSGTAGLDTAALKLAKAGSGHYRATTEDGQPVSSCYLFRVKFLVKD